jgi:hypothetical protein
MVVKVPRGIKASAQYWTHDAVDDVRRQRHDGAGVDGRAVCRTTGMRLDAAIPRVQKASIWRTE